MSNKPELVTVTIGTPYQAHSLASLLAVAQAIYPGLALDEISVSIAPQGLGLQLEFFIRQKCDTVPDTCPNCKGKGVVESRLGPLVCGLCNRTGQA